jgi:membrane protease YdiL (CAAX protease family)
VEPAVPSGDREPAPRSRDALALELGVVLLVTWLPAFVCGWEWGLVGYSADPSLTGALALLPWIVLPGYLGWRRGFFALRRPEPTLLADLAWGVGIAVAMLLVCEAARLLPPGAEGRTPLWPAPSSGLSYAYFWSALAVSATGEELLWRGYAFSAMRGLGARTSVCVLATSVLFASYHPYSPSGLLQILVMGLVLGGLRAWGASLVGLSLGHFLCNAVLFLTA